MENKNCNSDFGLFFNELSKKISELSYSYTAPTTHYFIKKVKEQYGIRIHAYFNFDSNIFEIGYDYEELQEAFKRYCNNPDQKAISVL